MKKTFNFIIEDDLTAIKYVKSIDWNRIFNKVYEIQEFSFDGGFVFSILGEKNLSWFSKMGLWFAPLMFFLRYLLEMSNIMNKILFISSGIFICLVMIELFLVSNSKWMNLLLKIGLEKKARYKKQVKFLKYSKFLQLKSKYERGGEYGSEGCVRVV